MFNLDVAPDHLGAICFILFQLPLMLILQHKCAVDTLNLIGLGATLHCLEHECYKLQVHGCQDGNVVPPVQCLTNH